MVGSFLDITMKVQKENERKEIQRKRRKIPKRFKKNSKLFNKFDMVNTKI